MNVTVIFTADFQGGTCPFPVSQWREVGTRAYSQ